MNQKQTESKSLVVSSAVNLIMAAAGIWAFAATNIHALFLDGMFSLIGFVSAVFAVVISKASKKTTAAYPDGLYFLEPLYAICKSLLTITLMVVSVAATASATYGYFYHGLGEPMIVGPVLPYTVCMVVLCFGLGLFNRRQNRKINNTSTILTAESKSNFVDGVLSLGVGIAIVMLYLIDLDGTLGFLHYTGDFFVTVILVLLSLKAPVAVLISAFKELSNGLTNDSIIKTHITKTIAAHLDGIVRDRTCSIVKVGMHIKVYISLPTEIGNTTVQDLVLARQHVLDELNRSYDSIKLIYDF